MTEPDISSRPHELTVERSLKVPPDVVYRAWTEQFDGWFAEPGTVLMRNEVDAPYYFETHFEGQRHPHYGRFLKLVPGKLIRMTWVTGNPGTQGAETVITLELSARGGGTKVKLSHAGFPDAKTCKGHEEAWPMALALLDEKMAGTK